jgi:hypothetical protein
MKHRPIDTRLVVPVSTYSSESEEERASVIGMLDEARSFLAGFPWCGQIKGDYISDIAIGGVVAIFFFEYVPANESADDATWVIVGDIPSAYISTDEAPNAACALDGYIGAMTEWVDTVRKGGDTGKLIPVECAPTPANAEALAKRLTLLDEEVLSHHRDQLQ